MKLRLPIANWTREPVFNGTSWRVRLKLLRKRKQFSQNILAKVKDTQELRKELQNVKKLARERAKAITLRISQLKDCKNHFDKKKEKGKGTMVFICEGQSAAGSITSCRECLRTATRTIRRCLCSRASRSTSGMQLWMSCANRGPKMGEKNRHAHLNERQNWSIGFFFLGFARKASYVAARCVTRASIR